MKTIGILTSGGDAPGMNAAIRAITRTGLYHDFRVKGIRFGYGGLIKGDIDEMNVSSVADIIQRGGTILGSARSKEFMTEEGRLKAYNVLEDFGIDAVVVLGGDGTYKGAKALSDMGVCTVGLPCTIDNDMGYTDVSIGFSTAVETVIDAISKIRDTSSSHGRGNVIEVMGRHCGDIALFSGLAGGAESIIVPEKKFSMEKITDRILRGKERGKLHHIIVLSEGVGSPYNIAEEIEKSTGIETRVTILGHIQRGGNPSATDRIIASMMGNMAVDLIRKGETGVALGIKGNQVKVVTLDEAVQTPHQFRDDLYDIATELSI